MPSNKKIILYPLLALVLGGLGAALRMWQFSHYADGLPAEGDPASLALLVLCGAAAVLFLVLALGSKEVQAGALYTRPSPIRAGLLLACAGLLILSAVFYLKNVLEGRAAGAALSASILELLLALVSIPTVVSAAYLAKDSRSGYGFSYNSLTVVFPILYCWVWLIDAYRRHTANPVLWDYVFLLLAVIALLLAAYGRAGFSFGDGKPRMTVFVSLSALFLVPIALTGHYGAASLFAILAMALYALSSLTGLLQNEPMPDFPESEQQTEVSADE